MLLLVRPNLKLVMLGIACSEVRTMDATAVVEFADT